MSGTGAERRNAGNGRSVNRSSKWLTPEKRAAIYIRDGFTCVYCSSTPRSQYHTHKTAIVPGLVIDHVHPRSRGGSNRAENLATACGDCNNRKCDLTIDEWLAQGTLYGARKLAGIRERVQQAAETPIDLRAGKQFVGALAARPLDPEHRRGPRTIDTGAPF